MKNLKNWDASHKGLWKNSEWSTEIERIERKEKSVKQKW